MNVVSGQARAHTKAPFLLLHPTVQAHALFYRTEQGQNFDRERIVIDLRQSRVGVATGVSRNAVLFKRKNHFGSLKHRRASADLNTGADLDDRSQVPYNAGEFFDNLGQRLKGQRLPPGAPDSEPADPLFLMNRVFPRPRQEFHIFTLQPLGQFRAWFR